MPGADGGPAVAHVDHHRALRCGFPEVVYGPGKTPDDLVRIAREILSRSERLLVTRVEGEPLARLLAAVPDAVHHARARAVSVMRGARGPGRPGIAIVSAGTADVPVAEEARVTAEALGEAPVAIYDVGRRGPPPPPRAARRPAPRARRDRRGGHGGRARERRRRARGPARGRGADERGLRREPRGRHAAARDDDVVRAERVGGQRRQRLRRGLRGGADQPRGGGRRSRREVRLPSGSVHPWVAGSRAQWGATLRYETERRHRRSPSASRRSLPTRATAPIAPGSTPLVRQSADRVHAGVRVRRCSSTAVERRTRASPKP